MGVGSVASMNSMPSVQMARTGSKDVKSKKIQNEITDLQQKMQKISSNEALSADEKANERKKRQQEISNLNTELRRRQDEVLRSQKREQMIAELQKDKEPAEEGKSADVSKQETGHQGVVIFKNSDGTVVLKGESGQKVKRGLDADKKQTDETKEKRTAEKEEKSIDDEAKETDIGLSGKNIHEIVSEDIAAEQAGSQRAVIAKIRGGIAVLKGEISQDERRGVNTDKKQAELEKLEKQEERARTLKPSAYGEKKRTKNPTENIQVTGIQNRTKANHSVNVSASPSEEAQASQQGFYVSLGN